METSADREVLTGWPLQFHQKVGQVIVGRVVKSTETISWECLAVERP